MKAAFLVSAKEFDIRDITDPRPPETGKVLVQILSVGVCGSDLHLYQTGMIGNLKVEEPHILGHEFSARIIEVGEGARSETGEALSPGMRVAVDPHVACGHCEQCREGHPNLCPEHFFYGVPPTNGALCEHMIVRAANCFPVPDVLSDDAVALLEPLGVGIHAVDLGKIRLGDTVAVIGCGPIGALIARLVLLSGAARVFAFDLLQWRAQAARNWGAEAYRVKDDEAVRILSRETAGRGADVVFEAAWSDHSVRQSAEMARPGGRLVIVGISDDDKLSMGHSEARRKGLTIRMARRMKHTYPRAIALASGPDPKLDLDDMVTDTYPLEEVAQGFADTSGYREGLMKAVIRLNS